MKKLFFQLAILFLAFSSNAQIDSTTPKHKNYDELFKVVEEMPRFPGCEDKGLSDKDRTDCSYDEIFTFISQNLKYPEEAQALKVEGRAVVQFVINKEGKLENIKLVRDLKNGCGEAALAVMRKMQEEITWIPGMQRGRKVNVLFTLPIVFKL